jgi:SAM-dependent methyltransferase
LSLRSLQKSWDRLGATDPLWAILTDPAKKNNGWDETEFFQTGVWEVDHILEWVERVHPLTSKSLALDFGCGVGRLSQPLADHFQEVRGVDISPSMIERARAFNRHGDRCRYFLHSEHDLALFADATFDFIYSSITLQHIRPRFTRLYLAEFARVLRPGGVLVFQLPSRMRGSMPRMRRLIYKTYYGLFLPLFRPDTAIIEMHALEQTAVRHSLSTGGAQILEVIPDVSAGPTWESFRYLVTKEC